MERTVGRLRGSLPKLKEKLLEALKAVLPIVGILVALCFSAGAFLVLAGDETDE